MATRIELVSLLISDHPIAFFKFALFELLGTTSCSYNLRKVMFIPVIKPYDPSSQSKVVYCNKQNLKQSECASSYTRQLCDNIKSTNLGIVNAPFHLNTNIK